MSVTIRMVTKHLFSGSLKSYVKSVKLVYKRKMSLLHDGLPLTGYQFSNYGICSTRHAATNGGQMETLNKLKVDFAKEMGVDHTFKRTHTHRDNLQQYLPKSQESLPKRSMGESYVAAIIPLGSDVAMQEKYTTFLGSVRLGRLVEDMDIFAVIVARKHILIPDLPKDIFFPQTIVTVLVDNIEFTDYLPKPDKDIKISGHVSWVSKSTLEVVVWLEQLENDKWKRITRALFLLAARDPTNTYASMVNAIEPANERERIILSGGHTRKTRRLESVSSHVSKQVPTPEEQKLLHDVYLQTTDPNDISMFHRVLPSNSVWMNSTMVSNVILAQPEDRNLHNTVFGGFIMRHAVELSFVSSFKFCKHRPRTRIMKDILFKRPIEVNSLIQMYATVVYTEGRFMQTIVYAQAYNPNNGTSQTTNRFHFTLEAPGDVPKVVPQSYYEAMLFIDGKRHMMKDLHYTQGDFRSKL